MKKSLSSALGNIISILGVALTPQDLENVEHITAIICMVVGLLITALREKDQIMLYRALSKQNNFSLDGKTLTFYIDDNATLSLFDGTENQALCENALREVTEDKDYQFFVVNAKSAGKKVNDEQMVKLLDVFGNKFENKNK